MLIIYSNFRLLKEYYEEEDKKYSFFYKLIILCLINAVPLAYWKGNWKNMNSLVFFYVSDFLFGLIFSIISIIIGTQTQDWFWKVSLIISLIQFFVSSAILGISFYNNLPLGPFIYRGNEKKEIKIEWKLGTYLKIFGFCLGIANKVTFFLYCINNDLASKTLDVIYNIIIIQLVIMIYYSVLTVIQASEIDLKKGIAICWGFPWIIILWYTKLFGIA